MRSCGMVFLALCRYPDSTVSTAGPAVMPIISSSLPRLFFSITSCLSMSWPVVCACEHGGREIHLPITYLVKDNEHIPPHYSEKKKKKKDREEFGFLIDLPQRNIRSLAFRFVIWLEGLAETGRQHGEEEHAHRVHTGIHCWQGNS